MGRNGIGIEIQPEVAEIAKKNIESEKGLFSKDVHIDIIVADSLNVNYEMEFERIGINQVQFVILHPPYWDIIKFSDNPNDLSNSLIINDFLNRMKILIAKINRILEHNRYCVLVIGDKYTNGEWIPLAFYTMQEFLNFDFQLKATIVKNFEDTRGKMNQKELWRYRALVGGFYIFKHEYIFLFKKIKKKTV